MKGAKSNKDKEMAAYLKKSGYPHGRRKSSTLAPPVPSMAHVGSAAYRRRIAAQQARRGGKGAE